MKKSLLLVICGCFLAITAPCSSAAIRYTIQDAGAPFGKAYLGDGLNDNGKVVGTMPIQYAGDHGYLWDKGIITDLGTLGGANCTAEDINNKNQIVGSSGTGTGYPGDYYRGFIWENGAMRVINTLSGYNQGYATAINDNSQVVGYCSSISVSIPDVRAFSWQNGYIRDLGYGTPNDINNNGKIVGSRKQSDGNRRAILWDTYTTKDLGVLPGAANSGATAINNYNQIVGYSGDHAVIWENGIIRDLGIYDFKSTCAKSINNKGQIVGYGMYADYTSISLLWENGNALDLNTLIAPDSGWTLTGISTINDSGQILGLGEYNGVYRHFLLTPVPEPSSIAALASGFSIAAFLFRRKRR